MKNSIALLGLLLSGGTALGQASIYAGDAFRYSEITQTGTARFRGLGGNHASLGGDASSISGNPAGLGYYNRSEISFSPSVNLISTQGNYIGTNTSATKANPNIGQFSLVLAGNQQNENRRWRRTALGISYNRQISFANSFTFQGRNNRSSIVDSYIEDANGRNVTGTQINNAYDQQNQQADYLAAAAYQLYLINGTPYQNNQNESGPPFYRYDENLPTDQRNTFSSTGAHSQWTVAYAGNLDNKLYIGASIGLNRIRYDFENVYRETPVNGTAFTNYGQTDNLTVKGNGVNFSLGMIYKPDQNLQIGASIVTPSWTRVQETFSQSVQANPRAGNPYNISLQANSVDVIPNDFDYSLSTPFRASGGATYFLARGKVGFITATADYVAYSGMRVTTSTYDTQGNLDFKNDVRREVQNTYKNVVNLRAGAEIRAGLLRVRGGVAYLPDPYQQQLNSIDRSKLLLSAGLGVRSDRFFADVSGTYNTFKSAYTPYYLSNSSDYASAQINNKVTNVTLTVGTFF